MDLFNRLKEEQENPAEDYGGLHYFLEPHFKG